MSYDIDFRVKVKGVNNRFVSVWDCDANITWNLRDMIVESTGLEWKNEENNGLCRNIIPCIAKGLSELTRQSEKYKKYESENGWGTLEGCKRFFIKILKAWESFCNDSSTKDLAEVTYFWII